MSFKGRKWGFQKQDLLAPVGFIEIRRRSRPERSSVFGEAENALPDRGAPGRAKNPSFFGFSDFFEKKRFLALPYTHTLGERRGEEREVVQSPRRGHHHHGALSQPPQLLGAVTLAVHTHARGGGVGGGGLLDYP